MLVVSILCRVNAPFHKSTFGIQEELLRGNRKSGDSNAKSDSYMRPICGCWLSSAYKSEVPERHIPTTKSGPGLIVSALVISAQIGPALCSGSSPELCSDICGLSHFKSTAVLMLWPAPARTLS